MKIPFIDLKRGHKTLQVEIQNIIASIVEQSAFIQGHFVSAFEKNFAEVHSMSHCISCGNGTDALFLILKALGIASGDEVLVPAMSWIATSEAVSLCGASVRFVDIHPSTFTLDVSALEKTISHRTKAIIPVHLYGCPADMTPLLEFCQKHNLFCVEDCAQAHFAEYDGKQVGTMGIASAFSFYPSKNLGALGDAGAVLTNDSDLAIKIRRLGNHGTLVKHDHEMEGMNSRMDGIQAGILSLKLKYLEEWTEKRKILAEKMDQGLKGAPQLQIHRTPSGRTHVHHLYVVEHTQRDELRKILAKKGVETGIHYPVALPFLKAYRSLNHTPKDFPVAFEKQSRILSLPFFPEMTREEIDYLIQAVQEACAEVQ